MQKRESAGGNALRRPPRKEFHFLLGRDLRITSWDEDMSGLTGISARRAMGKKYSDVIPKIMINGRDAVSHALNKRKRVTLRSCRFQCLYAQVSASVSICPEENGRRAKVILRPAAQCSLAAKMDRLQKLSNIGKVASTLAHGVRNPLNAMKGAVVYLRDRYSREETLLEFVDIIEAEITRLDAFITQFLSSAPSSDGGLATVNINDVIQKIKIYVSLQTYAHNITCEYALGSIPLLLINPFHLEQALLNVINNAIEAMSSGGNLRIGTRTEDRPEGQSIVIEVADTGPGLEQDRIDQAGSDHPAGRGFGLFIAYEMMKHYNGSLEIRGEKGRGTTARFSLPCPVDGDRS